MKSTKCMFEKKIFCAREFIMYNYNYSYYDYILIYINKRSILN